MKNAKIQRTNLWLSNGEYIFEAKGKVVLFPGFLKVYVEATDNQKERDDNEVVLPDVKENDKQINDDQNDLNKSNES